MKITHINHASILLEKDDIFIWTDPWVISPAFDSWTQNPYPRFKDIKKIFNLCSEKFYILISHGHDDHLDDFLLASKPFNDLKIIIPKLDSPGLKKRIQKTNPKREIIEVSSKKVDVGPFELRNNINQEYTGDDTIFTIRDSDHTLIHANDNWHRYPEKLISQIKATINPEKSNIFTVQLGIADCFPANYVNYSNEEKKDLIKNRYENYISTILENMSNLGLTKAFLYANQSRIPSFDNLDFFQKIKEEILKPYSKTLIQLNPGSYYCNKADNFYTSDSTNEGPNTLEVFLNKYQSNALNYLKKKRINIELQNFKFIILHNDNHISSLENKESSITIAAAPNIWADILIGKSNLESITIGGNGIFLKPKDLNISELHNAFSKWTYKQQSEILTNGFSLFFE